MRLKLNSVLTLGSCLLSTSAIAGSNSELIKNLYTNGTAAAAAEDFPERDFGSGNYVGGKQTQECVVVDKMDQPFGFDISRTIRVTEAEGPLVPGRRQEKLVFGNSKVSYNLFVEPVVQGIDLVVSNPIYSNWVSGTDGINHFIPAQLFARKSDQYIAFKVVVDRSSQNVNNGSFYGYCYTKDAKPLF
jgi:hypothetical protein